MTPTEMFHVTTSRKAKLYRQSGFILGPVRGFDTLQAAMLWAMRVGRKGIYRVECSPTRPSPQMLPDHHNQFGTAWWCGTVPVDDIECVVSVDDAWKPESKDPQP